MITQKMISQMSDDEFWQLIKPHVSRCDSYLTEHVIPMYIAFEIADAFNSNLLIEEPFKLTFDALTVNFNRILDVKSTMNLVNNILKNEYSLEIVATEPMLKIKEI